MPVQLPGPAFLFWVIGHLDQRGHDRGGDMLVALVSLALGAVAGELLGIEERLAALGEEAGRRRMDGGGRAAGFVIAPVLQVCPGAPAAQG